MAIQSWGNRFSMALRKAGRRFSSARPEETWFRAMLALAVRVPLFLLYGTLVRGDELLNRYDIFVVGPLREIHWVGEYLGRIRAGTVFDVLPLRDLSYQAGLIFWDVPRPGNFHLPNGVIRSPCAWGVAR